MARLFTSIFELAVDTTLQCFLCCEAQHGGQKLTDTGGWPSQQGNLSLQWKVCQPSRNKPIQIGKQSLQIHQQRVALRNALPAVHET